MPETIPVLVPPDRLGPNKTFIALRNQIALRLRNPFALLRGFEFKGSITEQVKRPNAICFVVMAC